MIEYSGDSGVFLKSSESAVFSREVSLLMFYILYV